MGVVEALAGCGEYCALLMLAYRSCVNSACEVIQSSPKGVNVISDSKTIVGWWLAQGLQGRGPGVQPLLGSGGGSGTRLSMNFIPVKFGIVTGLLATLLAACAPSASGVPAAPVVVTRIVEVTAEVVTEVVVTATQAAITHTPTPIPSPSPTVSSSSLIGEKIEITGKACQSYVDITKIVGKYLVSCIDGRWSNGVV